MIESSLNEDLLANVLPLVLPTKPVLTSQGCGIKEVFVSYYQHPSHQIIEHAFPYNVLEIVDYNSSSPHKRRLADNVYTQPLRGGEIFFYNQSVDHAVQWEKTVGFKLLAFRPQLFEDEFGCNSNADLFPLFLERDEYIHSAVTQIINDLEAGCPSGSDYSDWQALALARHILKQMKIKDKVVKECGFSPKKLREILDFIESSVADRQQPSLSDLVKIVDFRSQSHFSRLFKEAMQGTPPIEYVKTRALERAKHLLKRTDCNIAEVAEQCGFQSIRSFNDAFKGREKITPREFRREFR
jgi:AraC family transcriptional regulator